MFYPALEQYIVLLRKKPRLIKHGNTSPSFHNLWYIGVGWRGLSLWTFSGTDSDVDSLRAPSTPPCITPDR